MSDDEITLEALIELKEQIFSASDAEMRILEIEQDINSSIFNTCITKEERILSVSNKIMIRFQSYITKLINVTL